MTATPDEHRGLVGRGASAAHLAFVALTALAVIAVLYGNGGHFVLPSDDAYINMGLGRRFFEGTAHGEFPSGTTAFGWSLLFGGLTSLIGAGVVPVVLLVNVAGGLWTISLLASVLPQRGRSLPEVLFLVWAVVFIDLPLLALLGMEHLWHCAFVIASLIALGCLLDSRDARGTGRLVVLVLLAALCRQETMFLGIALAAVLIAHRFYPAAAGVVAAAFAPLVAQGLLQIAQGRPFLANPLAIKSSVGQDGAAALDSLLLKLGYIQPVDVALAMGGLTVVLFVAAFLPATSRLGRARALAAVALLYGFAHLAFAAVGWIGRYQAPVLACALAAFAAAFPVVAVQPADRSHSPIARLLYSGVLVLGLYWTGTANQRFWGLIAAPSISWEVEQQMCRIRDVVAAAPAAEPVILNDVGCTTFYLDNPILDLFGLTTVEVRNLGGKNRIGKQAIAELADRHQAKMAVIYEQWFIGRIPESWIKVGSWTTASTRYVDQPTITVYATAPQWRDEVASRWKKIVQRAGAVPGVEFTISATD